jgi:hypothetical protein
VRTSAARTREIESGLPPGMVGVKRDAPAPQVVWLQRATLVVSEDLKSRLAIDGKLALLTARAEAIAHREEEVEAAAGRKVRARDVSRFIWQARSRMTTPAHAWLIQAGSLVARRPRAPLRRPREVILPRRGRRQRRVHRRSPRRGPPRRSSDGSSPRRRPGRRDPLLDATPATEAARAASVGPPPFLAAKASESGRSWPTGGGSWRQPPAGSTGGLCAQGSEAAR